MEGALAWPCGHNSGHEPPPGTSSRRWRAKPPAPQRKSLLFLAPSGCETKRGCVQGQGAGGVFLHQPLPEPASAAEGDFPARADMLSPLSNCSLAQGSPVPERELAPSPPSHCLFPQPSSRGAHSFSSLAPSPALPHQLCLVPRISVSSPLLSPSSSFRFSSFFSPHPSVLPYATFCTEVQKAVGLRRGDAKVGCPL